MSEVKGFPAFPKGKRRTAASRSWWGDAWLQALEDTSMDQAQLRKGRRYAAAGRVGPITVSAGRIAATVYEADETPHHTVVLVDQLSDRDWARFLDQVAGKAGHIAALLDRYVPRELVDAADTAGVPLLPGIGDLEPECGCPGWEHPCMHAAALCFQAAWLLDEDPFVLLLLRGRGEQELLAELRSREAAPITADQPAGIDPVAMEFLVANAASRARDLLSATPEPELGLWQDTVRIAAQHRELAPRLGEASGRADLPLAARAWEFGGLPGLAVLTETWDPPRSVDRRAREAWEEDQPELEVAHNWWTAAELGVQLRYGRDERWYPYRAEPTGWWPAGSPAGLPATALAELLLG
ncbi:hypothetical protein GCM10010174_41810 [Kutzneria viridogrisea]|uniref:Zn finger protein n=1 Tax=Kutzneria viridogrisea TaxID=47990 RepID=A0ABR6BSB3_9PSEU|nr:putative Zn finger protein [Kutzneria viridogrisea]